MSMIEKSVRVAPALFLLSLVAIPLPAHPLHSAPTAVAQGTVSDSTGAPLPGVTVEGSCNGVNPNTVTAADGTYRLANLPAETPCVISFRLLNFATTVQRNVAADPFDPLTINVTLYLSASAQVVVTARQTFRNLADMNEPVNDLIGLADAASVGVVAGSEIERRPSQRAGEIMEVVPGVIVSQHSGEGKANQYYLRGFNLDHGTDLAITVGGAPVNMPTHGHGQGYADTNFLIPELIGAVQYKKGPYHADEGDFASAGAVNISYVTHLDQPIALAQGGEFGYRRVLVAGSPIVGDGFLLYGIEFANNEGPWVQPDDYRRVNGVLRYSRGGQHGGWSVTAMGYDADWSSTDQIPLRAVRNGTLSRFGLVDPSDGGRSHRYSLAAEWQRGGNESLTHAIAWALDYDMQLFSNFTYFLEDPIRGDQFEQGDDRMAAGVELTHRWYGQIAGATGENLLGFESRHDDIDNVGLYHTRERVRLSTIRSDVVRQSSGAVYAQNSTTWHPWLRTIAGVRADLFHFDVRSNQNEANSGRETEALVSPKLGVVLGPWKSSEIYFNAGYGFHSNDARGATISVDPVTGSPASPVDPLVRSRGFEIGARSRPVPRLVTTTSVWNLDLESELLFVGDAGTTEASRPSRRTGVELTGFYRIRPWLGVDGELAFSRARFRDSDPAGDRIPGAIEGVASAGLAISDFGKFSGMLRVRWFGPRPLVEDGSIRSDPSTLVSARLGWSLTPRIRLDLDIFNLLDEEASDVDYFYTSRLPGEPAEGVDGIHFHPVEPRSFRVGLATTF